MPAQSQCTNEHETPMVSGACPVGSFPPDLAPGETLLCAHAVSSDGVSGHYPPPTPEAAGLYGFGQAPGISVRSALDVHGRLPEGQGQPAVDRRTIRPALNRRLDVTLDWLVAL